MKQRSRIPQRLTLVLLVTTLAAAAKPPVSSPPAAPAPAKPAATDPVDVIEIPASQNSLYGLIVTPDGQTIISVDSARHVFLWSTGGWQLRSELIPDEKSDGVVAVALSRAGDLLAVNGSNSLDVWNLHTGKRITAARADNLRSLLFSDDGKTLYGQNIRGLYAVDVAGGKTVTSYSVHSNRAPTWLVDGKTLVSDVYPTKTGISYTVVVGASTQPAQSSAQFRANGNGLLVSADGKTALSLDAESEHVVWWDQATGKHLGSMAMTNGSSLALSPDGKTLAAAFDRGRVLLIDLASGAAMRTLEPVGATGRGMVFTPDGKSLAMLTEKSVKIYPLTDATTRPATAPAAPATVGPPVASPTPPAPRRRPAPAQTPSAQPAPSRGRMLPGGDLPGPGDVAPGGF